MNLHRNTIRVASATLLAIVLAAMPAHVTLAGSISSTCRVRNVTQDTHDRSFRRMVAAAHSGDLLRVRGTCGGGLAIRRDLVIEGAGPDATLSGRSRYRVLLIGRGAVVKLRNLTVTGGVGSVESYYDSGGVYNRGDLTMIDVTVTGNVADSVGGGILNSGSLILRDSRVSDNTVWSEEGGGIYNLGFLVMSGTRVSGNTSDWGAVASPITVSSA